MNGQMDGWMIDAASWLTGVGAVVFGPVQTSILAHLEIEALSAEQPGHDAL